jgi:ketosteroid isomerase-like protein
VSHAFRTAVESRDRDLMIDSLAEDVTFNSPVAFQPFEGKETVAQVLMAAFETFEDFRYTDELETDGVHALVFRARVGDKDVQGLDLIRTGDDGKIVDFTVMVRPASALMALGQAMGPKVAGLKAA